MAAKKPKEKFDPIELSVSDFIVQEFAKFDIACGNGRTLIMVIKECTVANWNEQQNIYVEEMEDIATGKKSKPDLDIDMDKVLKLFSDFGTRIPIMMMRDLEVHILYNGEVNLEFADPKFFDQLSEVIAYVATHDTVPGGSVKRRRQTPQDD